jgi:hypothetical protein
MKNFEPDHKLIHVLLARLERISVDSHWAHRASGVRGSLIKLAEQMDSGDFTSRGEAAELMDMGFIILECAALEKRGKNYQHPSQPSGKNMLSDQVKDQGACFFQHALRVIIPK